MAPKAPPVVGDWLNCDSVDWRSLRGSVTAVVFWSVGCEASLAVLNHLGDLRRTRFPDLMIVGVHSPRTADEFDRDRVVDSITRYGLDFPVLHDPERENWARYNPPGWPTVVIVSKRGRAVGLVQGTNDLALISDSIEAQLVIDPPKKKSRPPSWLPPEPSEHPLAWPAGVCALSDSQIVVSDQGNKRLLLVELDNTSGASLLGEIETNSAPGQLCRIDDTTFAASFPDAGTVVSYTMPILDGQATITTDLARGLMRPLGMTLDSDGTLLVADAAADRIHRVSEAGVGVIAGRSPNGTKDGRSKRATLSQPVGVARVGSGVAFTESSTSSLRVLTDSGKVLTTTRASADQPGLVDGSLLRASLLRPRDTMALPDGSILIVDTGNSRLRVASGRKLRTLGLNGLHLPEAACVLDDQTVLVADTGNHRLVLANLAEDTASEVTIEGLVTPADHIAADSTLTIPFPSDGDGPWQVTAHADPPQLIAGPLSVTRYEPGSVSLTVGPSGSGVVTVTSRSLAKDQVMSTSRIPVEIQ